MSSHNDSCPKLLTKGTDPRSCRLLQTWWKRRAARRFSSKIEGLRAVAALHIVVFHVNQTLEAGVFTAYCDWCEQRCRANLGRSVLPRGLRSSPLAVPFN